MLFCQSGCLLSLSHIELLMLAIVSAATFTFLFFKKFIETLLLFTNFCPMFFRLQYLHCNQFSRKISRPLRSKLVLWEKMTAFSELSRQRRSISTWRQLVNVTEMSYAAHFSAAHTAPCHCASAVIKFHSHQRNWVYHFTFKTENKPPLDVLVSYRSVVDWNWHGLVLGC